MVSVFGATSSSVHEVKAITEKEAKRMIANNFFMAGVIKMFKNCIDYPSLIGEPPLFMVSVFGATSSSVHEVKAIIEKAEIKIIVNSFFITQ